MRLTTAIPTELQEMIFALFCLFLFVLALLVVAHLYHFFDGLKHGARIMDATEKDDEDFLNASHFRKKQP